MRTDFLMTAKQVKEVFPASKLQPREDFVFRGVRQEDVPGICAIDGRMSGKEVLRSLEKGNETVFLVAASEKGVVGHEWVSAPHSGEFTVQRILVREDCEQRGIGTGLVVAFFCFAGYSKASSIRFFSPTVKLNNILVRLGIKQPKKQVSLAEAAEHIREKGLADISRYVV